MENRSANSTRTGGDSQWRGTLRLRTVKFFLCGTAAILLVSLLLIYWTQSRFLYNGARESLLNYSGEFYYEYLTQQDEPPDGIPVAPRELPLGCLERLHYGGTTPITPLAGYYSKDQDRYYVAGLRNHQTLLATYDAASNSIVSETPCDPAGALSHIDREFNEESYSMGRNNLYLLLMDERGDVGACSYFDKAHLKAFSMLFEEKPPRNGFHRIRTDNGPILAHTRRIYDGNYLVVAQSTSEIEENLRHLMLLFLLVFVLFVPLEFLVAVIFSRRISRRILHIGDMADEIARGNFSMRLESESGISEIEKLVATFNHMTDNTQKLLTELQDVTDDIAHDLRTPLTRMKARAELQMINARDRDFAALVAEECDELLSTINTMLEITRIEKRFDKARCQDVDVRSVLQKLTEAFSTLAEDKGIRLILNLPETEVTMKCQERRLEQMVANLLDNALKYTPPGGRVAVTLAKGASEITLSVADTGGGIPKEDLPKIFDRFFRGDASRSKPGNGLGLSMVRAVAESLGGQVQAECPPEGGTVFQLRFHVGGQCPPSSTG